VPIIFNMQGMPQAMKLVGVIELPASPPANAYPDQHLPPAAGAFAKPSAWISKFAPHVVVPEVPAVPVVAVVPAAPVVGVVPAAPVVAVVPAAPVVPPAHRGCRLGR
jgi:hypothetical protein